MHYGVFTLGGTGTETDAGTEARTMGDNRSRPLSWFGCMLGPTYGLFTLSVSGTPEPGPEKMGCMRLYRMFHITQGREPHCSYCAGPGPSVSSGPGVSQCD